MILYGSTCFLNKGSTWFQIQIQTGSCMFSIDYNRRMMYVDMLITHSNKNKYISE